MTDLEQRAAIGQVLGWEAFDHERGDGQMEIRYNRNGVVGCYF